MSFTPDVCILVTIELFKGLRDLEFKPFRRAIANYMKNPSPDPLIGVLNHFKDPLPEGIYVFLDFTWAELLHCT